MLEMAGEVGVKWTRRLLNVCMQEGRIPKEWRMGLIVQIYGRGKGVCMTQESTGASHNQPSTETIEEGFRRKDQEKSMGGDFGEEQQGFRRGEGQQTGCTSWDIW